MEYYWGIFKRYFVSFLWYFKGIIGVFGELFKNFGGTLGVLRVYFEFVYWYMLVLFCTCMFLLEFVGIFVPFLIHFVTFEYLWAYFIIEKNRFFWCFLVIFKNYFMVFLILFTRSYYMLLQLLQANTG